MFKKHLYNIFVFAGQVIYIKKSKLNIADMWVIPLDRVTFNLFSNLAHLWLHKLAFRNLEVNLRLC